MIESDDKIEYICYTVRNKEEKMLKLYKKNIVREGIHFVYVYNDSRGIEFARIDIGPEIFMYE